MLAKVLSHGVPSGLLLLGDPPREFDFSRREVDVVRDSYLSDEADALREGDPHPEIPGCIIDQAKRRGPFGQAGQQVWEFELTSIGDARGTRPTKVIGRSQRRVIESGWDERGIRVLSWEARWRDIVGLASTDTIYCEAHGFPNGKRVYLGNLTGGSGVEGQSSTSLGVPYWVCNRGANSFQLSAALGGAPVALVTDITAGQVIAAEFALGAPHPDFPTMFLAELQAQDDYTDWQTVDCLYRGLERAKPFHRQISVNGQQFSSSEPITVDLAGGWGDARNTQFQLPEIVVTDTYLLGSGSLPTAIVPGFNVPPNPPIVSSLFISAPTSKLIFNYPYGWTCVSTPTQATLSSQIQAMVYSIVYRYVWPVIFK